MLEFATNIIATKYLKPFEDRLPHKNLPLF